MHMVGAGNVASVWAAKQIGHIGGVQMVGRTWSGREERNVQES